MDRRKWSVPGTAGGSAVQDIDSLLTQRINRLHRSRQWAKFWVVTACIVVAVLLLANFVLGFASVHGDSMAPALCDGDTALVWKPQQTYQQGDIVLFQTAAVDGIQAQRVIACPGDRVEIDEKAGCVLVNGTKLEEPYAYAPTTCVDLTDPITLGEDSYFLLGDNRTESADSRSAAIGAIPGSAILGKVIFLFRGV